MLHVALGFVAGAAFGAGFEAAKQILRNEPINLRKIGVSAFAGGVAGTLAAATGGVALLGVPAITNAGARLGVTAGAEVLEGFIERGFDGDAETEVFDPGSIVSDVVSGTVGGYVGDKFAEGFMDNLLKQAKAQARRGTINANSGVTSQIRAAGRELVSQAQTRISNIEKKAGVFAFVSALISEGFGKTAEESIKTTHAKDKKVDNNQDINTCGQKGNKACVILQ